MQARVMFENRPRHYLIYLVCANIQTIFCEFYDVRVAGLNEKKRTVLENITEHCAPPSNVNDV